MKKTKELSFEGGLERLEELVTSLEGRSLNLEAALEAFEEGLALSHKLRKKLSEAEKKVELLTSDLNGRPSVEPLNQYVESAPFSPELPPRGETNYE
ncbi:MAG: exodeoxyribonuclease VII small subunit [Candidatus Adiutrix sp.]